MSKKSKMDWFCHQLRQAEMSFYHGLLSRKEYIEWDVESFDVQIINNCIRLSIRGVDKIDGSPITALQELSRDQYGNMGCSYLKLSYEKV